MKATPIFIFFFTLKYLSKISVAFLNEEEESVTKALTEHLEIRHRILIQNENETVKTLSNIKNYAKRNMPFLVLSIEGLYKYFLRESTGNLNTLIILKVSDIKTLSNLLRTLNFKYSCYYCFLSPKWIVYLNNTLLLEQERELEIPLYSFILIAVKKNSNRYLLKEIYKVKEKTFSFDYGTWNLESGLMASRIPIYTRRFNLNNTELIVNLEKTNHSNCISVRYCAHMEIVEEFSKLMNLRLTRVYYPKHLINPVMDGDVLKIITGHSTDNLDFLSYDYVGPFFKITGNWYIKMPILLEQSDYFIKPFHYELWMSIFVSLLVGAIIGIILYCGNKYFENQYKLFDYFFMPFESLCNQDGFPKKDGVPIRIICFTFRFLALFIISAYSGTLISFLAVRQPHIPFQTLQEFADDGTYIIGTPNKTYTHTHFATSKDPLIRHIYQNYFIGLENSEIPEKFCNGKLALIEPDNDIYTIGIDCPIYQIKQPINNVLTVTALRKHSIYTRIFNHEFLKFYSSGVQKKLQVKVVGKPPSTPEDTTLGDVPFNQIIQVWSTLPIGVILGFMILVIENFIFTLKKRSKIVF